MNEIKVTKTAVVGSGAVHAKVFVNDKDIGMVYLTKSEYDIFVNALRHGANNTEAIIVEE